jgi:hypothetical protein
MNDCAKNNALVKSAQPWMRDQFSMTNQYCGVLQGNSGGFGKLFGDGTGVAMRRLRLR